MISILNVGNATQKAIGVLVKPFSSSFLELRIGNSLIPKKSTFGACMRNTGKLFTQLRPYAVICLFGTTPASAATCLHLETERQASYWVNVCSKRLIIKWIDQGSCSGGCMRVVSADGRLTVTKIHGRYKWWECDFDAYLSETCLFP